LQACVTPSPPDQPLAMLTRALAMLHQGPRQLYQGLSRWEEDQAWGVNGLFTFWQHKRTGNAQLTAELFQGATCVCCVILAAGGPTMPQPACPAAYCCLALPC
jgi:hypothetical protein